MKSPIRVIDISGRIGFVLLLLVSVLWPPVMMKDAPSSTGTVVVHKSGDPLQQGLPPVSISERSEEEFSEEDAPGLPVFHLPEVIASHLVHFTLAESATACEPVAAHAGLPRFLSLRRLLI